MQKLLEETRIFDISLQQNGIQYGQKWASIQKQMKMILNNKSSNKKVSSQKANSTNRNMNEVHKIELSVIQNNDLSSNLNKNVKNNLLLNRQNRQIEFQHRLEDLQSQLVSCSSSQQSLSIKINKQDKMSRKDFINQNDPAHLDFEKNILKNSNTQILQRKNSKSQFQSLDILSNSQNLKLTYTSYKKIKNSLQLVNNLSIPQQNNKRKSQKQLNQKLSNKHLLRQQETPFSPYLKKTDQQYYRIKQKIKLSNSSQDFKRINSIQIEKQIYLKNKRIKNQIPERNSWNFKNKAQHKKAQHSQEKNKLIKGLQKEIFRQKSTQQYEKQIQELKIIVQRAKLQAQQLRKQAFRMIKSSSKKRCNSYVQSINLPELSIKSSSKTKINNQQEKIAKQTSQQKKFSNSSLSHRSQKTKFRTQSQSNKSTFKYQNQQTTQNIKEINLIIKKKKHFNKDDQKNLQLNLLKSEQYENSMLNQNSDKIKTQLKNPFKKLSLSKLLKQQRYLQTEEQQNQYRKKPISIDKVKHQRDKTYKSELPNDTILKIRSLHRYSSLASTRRQSGLQLPKKQNFSQFFKQKRRQNYGSLPGLKASQKTQNNSLKKKLVAQKNVLLIKLQIHKNRNKLILIRR